MSSRLILDKHSFQDKKSKRKTQNLSSVLVSAIYNGWLDITRKMLDNKTHNVNSGTSSKKSLDKVVYRVFTVVPKFDHLHLKRKL